MKTYLDDVEPDEREESWSDKLDNNAIECEEASFLEGYYEL